MGWWATTSPPPPPVPKPAEAKHESQGTLSEQRGRASEINEQADRKGAKSVEEELAAFHPVFGESQASDSQTAQTQHGLSPQPRRSSSEQAPNFPITYPSSMSCRDSFDRAFQCRNLGGRFTSIYRYGETQDCSAHWSEFWFCMRVWQKAPGVRQAMIQEYYREKEEGKYGGKPSSEDVWRQRRERVVGAFGTELEGMVELVDVRKRAGAKGEVSHD